MLNSFLDQLKNFDFKPHDKVIIACSGGSDSIALLSLIGRTMEHHHLDAVVAYFDHCLRPQHETDQDINAIKTLTNQYHLRLEIATAPPCYWENNLKNIEAQARQLRYSFFHQLLKSQHAKSILLAHTQDDQIETVYMRLLTLTGLRGLKAIAKNNTPFARPLLSFKKIELVSYLSSNNIKWHEDSSNKSQNFWRNKVRNQIVHLNSIDDRWPRALLSLAKRAQEAVDLLDYNIKQQDMLVSYQGNSVSYPLSNFVMLPPLLQTSLLFNWFVYLNKGIIEKDYRLPERFFKNLNYEKQGSIILQGYGIKLSKKKGLLTMALI